MKVGDASRSAFRCWRVLAGDRRQALARLGEALRDVPPGRCLWFGDQAPPGIRPLSVRDLQGVLGSECDLLVYDAHAGLCPDALAALLGTLRGGGALLLLTPDWGSWPEFDDPALERFAPWPLDGAAVGRRFVRRLQHLLESAGQDRIQPVERPVRLRPPWSAPVPLVLTEDQRRAVEAIERAALGHARRPVVLLADRGRGKSTAIGSALARLLAQRAKRILLLAPSSAAVGAVFDQLARELPEGRREGGCFRHIRGEVRLCRPVDCPAGLADFDLVVVDEAAALGIPLLQRLCDRHNRLVFSTTVHGYEGSGRGFVHRFCAFLDSRYRQWRRLELRQPVRWAPGDPLEALADRLFLLSAEPGFSSPSQPPPRAGEGREETPRAGEEREETSQAGESGSGELSCRWLEQDELAGDEGLLSALYGLLVSAHYQTRPSDLQRLLDAPDVRILAALGGGVPVGVLVMVAEGGMPVGLADAVCAGRRRPRGHQLVQSLAQHGGWCEAPGLHLWRVMRIAVAGPARRQGIGSALLDALHRQADEARVDLLGTSFGLEAGLLRFWLAGGYRPVRVGHRLDPASAARSVQLLRPLSDAGRRLSRRAVGNFQRDLPWRLGRELADLPPEAAALLLRGRDCADLPLSEDDRAGLDRFAKGRLGVLDLWPVLWRWAVRELARGLPDRAAGPVARMLQTGPDRLGKTEAMACRALVHELLDRD